MKAYFHGDLVLGEELEETAKQRQKKCQEVTTPESNKDSYLGQGWKLKKKYKRSVRLFKEKKIDELIEDEVWLLFKNMGFTEINRDRNFRIQAGPIKKQIDVFAKDGHNVFVVECKAQSEQGPRSLRKDIHEILNLRKDIFEAIRNYYKERKLRVVFLLVTRNIIWNQKDEELASEKGLFFWKEKDLEAYINLTRQQGEEARFEMYSILFLGRKTRELENIKVPAMRGGRGKRKYYVFVIQPEKLLHGVTYVHRREESNPEEVSKAYQRMLNKKRLEKIHEYVEKGGFFPNNIILNFTQKPKFDSFGPKAEFGDIAYGILTFPPYYGSAWVIDGQHRLYGYSKSKKRTTATLPVLAFECLNAKDQGNLFVDINKEQKAVSSNLLWDLYPDIYHGAKEERCQILRATSLIVKRLNFESDSPLRKHIYIPSVPKEPKEVTNLTIANVCDGIKDNRLIYREEGLLYDKDYDYTVDFASKKIKVYFDVIAKSFPEDWKKGDKGLLRTNVGIRIFLIILRQLLRYLKYEGLEQIYRKKDSRDFENKTKEIFGPVLSKLKGMRDAERERIRKGSSKGAVSENAQMLIWDLKEEISFGVELWYKGGWTPEVPREESDENIRALLEDTEKTLRNFIIKELKKTYGDRWWRQGITKGVKDDVEEKIESQISTEPWKKDELQTLDPERKFMGFTDTPSLKQTIQFTPNWRLFENVFIKDKEYTMAQFKSFEFIRNKYQHFAEHECDEISKNLGYWGMQWIRRCIGLGKKIKKT